MDYRFSRRQALASAAAFAAGILLPVDVRSAGLSPEELEVQALALGSRVEEMGPAVALQVGRAHLKLIEATRPVALRSFQLRPLSRAASITAMACARASRWSGAEEDAWLTLAETEAAAADDGPLLAKALLERANSETARAADCSSPAAKKLYAAAIRRAGAAREQAGIRASIRFQLAWEVAAEGDKRAALMELDAATYEAQQAGWADPVIASHAGCAQRKIGRLVDAELALNGALVTPPVRRIWVLCDLARMHLESGDADAAAATLEEAFLLTRSNGIEGRLRRILGVRSLLPPGRAKRALTEVMHGV